MAKNHAIFFNFEPRTPKFHLQFGKRYIRGQISRNVTGIGENRAPIFSLVTWIIIVILNTLLPPIHGIAGSLFNISVLTIALIAIPLYLSNRWNLGEAGFYLGFGLIFWALGDVVCNFFSIGSGGFCFLLRHWYPAPFLILLRLFGGAILILYLILNPEVGTEPIKLPRMGSSELTWLLRVGLVLAVILFATWGLYQGVARSGFGGDVIYVLTGDYRELDQPELVYEGIIARVEDGGNVYVLVREQFDNPDLELGRIGGVPWDQQVIEEYLGLEVEILGKLTQFDPQQSRLLYPGRIRHNG